jgi:hypothetical protein
MYSFYDKTDESHRTAKTHEQKATDNQAEIFRYILVFPFHLTVSDYMK